MEAAEIGHGGSGRNAGLVNAGLWLAPDDVEARLGPEQGRKLNDLLAAGPDRVFTLIEEHGIACEATRAGTLHCAHSKAGYEGLRERFGQLQGRGAPVALLDAETARQRSGAAAIHGALWDGRAGTIQPLAYVRGLARAAIAAGARLHERSPALSIEHDGNHWCIALPEATLRAPVLLVVTNAYAGSLRSPDFRNHFTSLPYFQIATAPLGHNVRPQVLPGGEGCWDTAKVMSSYRLDEEGRLILGSVGRLDGVGGQANRDWVQRRLRQLFPQVGDIELSYAWFGEIAMTADHLPSIVPLGHRGLAVMGYNGRGISPGTVFGTALGDWALTGDESVLPMVPREAPAAPLNRLAAGAYALGAAAFHALQARF